MPLFLLLGEKALVDAGVPYSAVEQACVGYVYGVHFHAFFIAPAITHVISLWSNFNFFCLWS